MDREKVIIGLEHCKIGKCVECPYDPIREESLHGKHDKWELVCNEQLTEDILALLKEREAKTGHWNGPECSHCHAILDKRPNYEWCPHCGAHMIEEAKENEK